MGGPPLVSPRRVKVGGPDRNEEWEIRNTWFAVIAPRPVMYSHKDFIIDLEFNTLAGACSAICTTCYIYR